MNVIMPYCEINQQLAYEGSFIIIIGWMPSIDSLRLVSEKNKYDIVLLGFYIAKSW